MPRPLPPKQHRKNQFTVTYCATNLALNPPGHWLLGHAFVLRLQAGVWVDPAKAGNLSVGRSGLVSACAGDRWAVFAGGQIPLRTTVDMLGKLGGRQRSFRGRVWHG